MSRFVSLLVVAATLSVGVHAQPPSRPRATLTARYAGTVHPGESAHLILDVTLSPGLHVQANKPRDPSLIPTTLTVTAPAGVTILDTKYPAPSTFSLAGSSQVLDVFGEKFSIEVDLTLAAAADVGDLVVPARLRYQACDASSCFAPATATAQWTLHVTGGSR